MILGSIRNQSIISFSSEEESWIGSFPRESTFKAQEMTTPVVDPQPQMNNEVDSNFYVGQKINTLQHARSLRNSVIIRDTSANSINSINSNIPLNSNEQRTGIIQMTSSPSLSALAGILNEKTKQADMMVRKLSTNFVADTIKEETEEPAEGNLEQNSSNIAESGSPNLIDLADNDEAIIFKHPIPLNPSVEQPDFLTTPKVQQQTKENSAEPLINDQSSNSFKSEVRSLKSDNETDSQYTIPTIKSANECADEDPHTLILEQKLNIDEPLTPTVSLMQETVSLEIQKNTPVLQRLDSNVKGGQDIDTSKSKRRRSLLNFWRKPKQSTEKQMSTSKSFSLASKKGQSNEDLKGPGTKRSLSSSSIFTTFRKNKNNDSNAVKKSDNVVVERHTESQILPKNNTRPQKVFQKRKPTPLNFVKDVPELTTEDKFPRDVFPKSLDVSEVESIVSLERSRSMKSNQRNSMSSLRTRSLSDHISLNAKMEGMFITEATRTSFATPDLTKSPVSSILRSGKFETTSDEKISASSDLDNSHGTRSASFTISPQQRDFSFGSIEQKLNELTMESDQEDQLEKPLVQNKATKSSLEDSDNEDNELISDIMEFASIIDFGQDIELNFDLYSDNRSHYETLNPVKESVKNSLSKPSFNTETENSFLVELTNSPEIKTNSSVLNQKQTGLDDQKHISSTIKTRDTSPENVSSSNQNTFSDSSLYFDNYDEEDFENEDFNGIHAVKESPKINAFLPDITTSMSRPISMSFRGLKAPQFNSTMELSGLTGLEHISDQMSKKSEERSSYAAKLVKFSSQIVLYETYGELEYDRHPDSATCNQLTPQLAQMIKDELNELKAEMDIHEDSMCNTHFF